MEWGRLVHLMRIAFATIFAAGIFVALGLLGHLGLMVQHILDTFFTTTGNFLTQNATALDQLWKLIGGLVSLASGVWLIFRIWHYSEPHLPMRLHRYLEKHDDRFNNVKGQISRIAGVKPPYDTVPMPISFVGPLNASLSMMGFNQASNLEPQLDATITQIQSRRDLAAKHHSQCERDLGLSYLLKGVSLSARASAGCNPTEKNNLSRQAEIEIETSIKYLGRDPTALFCRALNFEYMGEQESALRDYLEIYAQLRAKQTPCDLLARSCLRAATALF